MGLKHENDINKYLKASTAGTQEFHGLTCQSKKQNSSNLFNFHRKRTISQFFGKLVQGSREKVKVLTFKVATNRLLSKIKPIQSIHSFNSSKISKHNGILFQNISTIYKAENLKFHKNLRKGLAFLQTRTRIRHFIFYAYTGINNPKLVTENSLCFVEGNTFISREET